MTVSPHAIGQLPGFELTMIPCNHALWLRIGRTNALLTMTPTCQWIYRRNCDPVTAIGLKKL